MTELWNITMQKETAYHRTTGPWFLWLWTKLPEDTWDFSWNVQGKPQVNGLVEKKNQSTIFLPANFRIFVSTFRCKSGKTWFDSNKYSKHMLQHVEFSLEPTPKNGVLTCQKSKQKPKVAEKRKWAQHSSSPHFPLIHAPINYTGW